ncbi:MAG: hypothetical protein KAI47_26865, partial [Deltaproteobacteria bacterium]|nr:hypothetical protein [Deltaproteobacteria bacterium]
TFRPELAIIVDFRGKQIGRLGKGAAKMKPGQDGLIGYPLVAAAMRGYLADDTWNLDNHLFVMAAAPVVSRNRNRYVGALLLGKEIDKEFATRLKRQLVGSPDSPLANVDVAFFLRGKILSSSVKNPELTKLPRRFSKSRDKILEKGRSSAFFAGKGSDRRLVVMAPLRGEAAAHDAFYAVITKTPKALGLFSTLKKLNKGDFPPGVWLLLGGVFLGILIVGFFLLHVEHSAPIQRLVDDVHKLSQSDISRLEEHTYRGAQYRLAHLINEIIDRTPKRSGKDINKILDAQPTPGFPADSHDKVAPQSNRVAHGGAMPPVMSPTASSPALRAIESPGLDLDGPHVDRLPAVAEGVMALDGLGSDRMGPTLDLEKDAPSRETEKPAPFALSPLGNSASDEALPTLTPMALPDEEDENTPTSLKAPERPLLEVKVTAQQSAGRDKTRQGPFGSELAALAPNAAPPLSKEADTAESQEDYFKKIFEEFVAIKRSCGETTDKLTLDRFSTKLKKNRQSLIERYGCSDVRFRVYIKDGKAALKATPITD